MMGQFGEDYGPEDDEFHKGIHVKLGGDPDNWKPHRDRPVTGDHVELKVPKRYKAAQDVIMKMFAQITDIDVNNLDVDYTTGSRSVMIDGETPHPSILSALNGTLDKLDTGEIAGLYKEGNKFSGELDKARKQGKDEMEIDGKKIPVTEFILSMYDRETGQFPKGETAVLTAIEKDYGEQFINPAKQFIEAINAKFEEFNGYRDPDLAEDMNAIMAKAGKDKHGKGYMNAAREKAQKLGRKLKPEERDNLRDKHSKNRKTSESFIDRKGRNVDEEYVRDLLKQFDHEANIERMYGDVNPETVIRHLEQGDVQAAVDEVHHRYAGQDGEEGDRGFLNLLDELEDDFSYVVSHNDDGQPSSYDEYQDLSGGDDYDFGQYDETINDIKKLSGI